MQPDIPCTRFAACPILDRFVEATLRIVPREELWETMEVLGRNAMQADQDATVERMRFLMEQLAYDYMLPIISQCIIRFKKAGELEAVKWLEGIREMPKGRILDQTCINTIGHNVAKAYDVSYDGCEEQDSIALHYVLRKVGMACDDIQSGLILGHSAEELVNVLDEAEFWNILDFSMEYLPESWHRELQERAIRDCFALFDIKGPQAA